MPKDWEFSDDPKPKPQAASGGGSYLLSPDVTNPLAALALVDPKNGRVVETKTGGIEFASVETESGSGISRLLASDGKQLEQYPGVHGGFAFVDGRGAYGRCSVEGPLVAFKTRPQDPPYVYTLKRLP